MNIWNGLWDNRIKWFTWKKEDNSGQKKRDNCYVCSSISGRLEIENTLNNEYKCCFYLYSFKEDLLGSKRISMFSD